MLKENTELKFDVIFPLNTGKDVVEEVAVELKDKGFKVITFADGYAFRTDADRKTLDMYMSKIQSISSLDTREKRARKRAKAQA